MTTAIAFRSRPTLDRSRREIPSAGFLGSDELPRFAVLYGQMVRDVVLAHVESLPTQTKVVFIDFRRDLTTQLGQIAAMLGFNEAGVTDGDVRKMLRRFSIKQGSAKDAVKWLLVLEGVEDYQEAVQFVKSLELKRFDDFFVIVTTKNEILAKKLVNGVGFGKYYECDLSKEERKEIVGKLHKKYAVDVDVLGMLKKVTEMYPPKEIKKQVRIGEEREKIMKMLLDKADRTARVIAKGCSLIGCTRIHLELLHEFVIQSQADTGNVEEMVLDAVEWLVDAHILRMDTTFELDESMRVVSERKAFFMSEKNHRIIKRLMDEEEMEIYRRGMVQALRKFHGSDYIGHMQVIGDGELMKNEVLPYLFQRCEWQQGYEFAYQHRRLNHYVRLWSNTFRVLSLALNSSRGNFQFKVIENYEEIDSSLELALSMLVNESSHKDFTVIHNDHDALLYFHIACAFFEYSAQSIDKLCHKRGLFFSNVFVALEMVRSYYDEQRNGVPVNKDEDEEASSARSSIDASEHVDFTFMEMIADFLEAKYFEASVFDSKIWASIDKRLRMPKAMLSRKRPNESTFKLLSASRPSGSMGSAETESTEDKEVMSVRSSEEDTASTRTSPVDEVASEGAASADTDPRGEMDISSKRKRSPDEIGAIFSRSMRALKDRVITAERVAAQSSTARHTLLEWESNMTNSLKYYIMCLSKMRSTFGSAHPFSSRISLKVGEISHQLARMQILKNEWFPGMGNELSASFKSILEEVVQYESKEHMVSVGPIDHHFHAAFKSLEDAISQTRVLFGSTSRLKETLYDTISEYMVFKIIDLRQNLNMVSKTDTDNHFTEMMDLVCKLLESNRNDELKELVRGLEVIFGTQRIKKAFSEPPHDKTTLPRLNEFLKGKRHGLI